MAAICIALGMLTDVKHWLWVESTDEFGAWFISITMEEILAQWRTSGLAATKPDLIAVSIFTAGCLIRWGDWGLTLSRWGNCHTQRQSCLIASVLVPLAVITATIIPVPWFQAKLFRLLWVVVNIIYGCPIFKWVEETWRHQYICSGTVSVLLQVVLIYVYVCVCFMYSRNTCSSLSFCCR